MTLEPLDGHTQWGRRAVAVDATALREQGVELVVLFLDAGDGGDHVAMKRDTGLVDLLGALTGNESGTCPECGKAFGEAK